MLCQCLNLSLYKHTDAHTHIQKWFVAHLITWINFIKARKSKQKNDSHLPSKFTFILKRNTVQKSPRGQTKPNLYCTLTLRKGLIVVASLELMPFCAAERKMGVVDIVWLLPSLVYLGLDTRNN